VERRAEVVAAEVRDPAVEMPEGVGAVHHHGHAAGSSSASRSAGSSANCAQVFAE